ncbi:hypothetical protein [Cohnella sp. GbtcB17]|nr:hypothetical protein [Cohnella sp. GbtcB17]
MQHLLIDILVGCDRLDAHFLIEALQKKENRNNQRKKKPEHKKKHDFF